MTSFEIGGPSRRKESWKNCESTGLVDIVWACFLHDYDVEDDYEISVISEEETISNNGDLENKEIYDDESTKTNENDKDAKLKKSLLIASLKRSTELLAYSEKLDVVRSPVPIDEKSHQGEENNRDTNLDLDERDNYYIRDGLGIDHGGDGDFEVQRDGPPTMIFLTRQDDQIEDDESRLTYNDFHQQQTIVEDVKTTVNKTKDFVSLNKNAATSRMMSSRRGDIVRDSGNCTTPTPSSMYSVAEGYKNDLLTLEERTQAELKEIERKKLIRRISLLRIRAAKARLAKYDDNS
ncbi:MAG: hypothetical protein ACI8RD_000961 [Bacillariaceae sp.]|jgi:hypothetical protein